MLLAAFLVFLRVKPVPSCTDNRRNQGEEETDCGGSSCTPCSVKHAKDIITYWARIVPLRSGVYDVAAEIENINEAVSSGDVNYTFTLFDGQGVIAERTGNTFMYAHERTLVTEEAIAADRVPTGVRFVITSVIWQARADLRPAIVVVRREYAVVEESDGRRKSTINAIVRNDTGNDFRRALVQFVTLDTQDNLIGANKLVVEDFRAGQSRSLTAVWPEEFTATIASIRIESRVNIFDPSAIVTPH